MFFDLLIKMNSCERYEFKKNVENSMENSYVISKFINDKIKQSIEIQMLSEQVKILREHVDINRYIIQSFIIGFPLILLIILSYFWIL